MENIYKFFDFENNVSEFQRMPLNTNRRFNQAVNNSSLEIIDTRSPGIFSEINALELSIPDQTPVNFQSSNLKVKNYH